MAMLKRYWESLLLLCVLLGCVISTPTAPVENNAVLEVAFTQPVVDGAGLDEELVQAIDAATQSVDVAAYELDLPSVTEALVRAHERGLAVRLVTDGDYKDELGPEELQQAGVPVVIERRDPFMHNKFVVIDRQQVWTGSWNLTYNGTYRNDNNVIIASSAALAENYTAEFEEMFTRQIFGPDSPANTPNPEVQIGSIQLQNYFSPEDRPKPHIVAALKAAQSSIYMLAFSFTDDDIANLLTSKHRGGLTVRAVLETSQYNTTGGDYETLRKAGVDVLLDGNNYNMHHKVIIIDEAVVITGSYNFTRSAAEYNDENLLIIYSPEVAAEYIEEFERVYALAEGQ